MKGKLIKENKNRYFIIFFMYTYDGGFGYSNGTSIASNNKYFNGKSFMEDITKQLEKDLNHKINAVILTNLIELNKKDFQQYQNKEI